MRDLWGYMRKKILILSVNPKDTARLRLDEEVREITEGLKLSKNRKQFTLHQTWAVRLRDLRRAMLEYEPQIVHFCGHGEENGLLVEDVNGKPILVSPDALSGLFALFADQVECVLLNACYSKNQAEAINKHINYVIGMSEGIQDKVAVEFAVGFYDTLGAGKSIEEAFKFGRNAIELYGLPQHLVPRLLIKKNETNILNQVDDQISKSSNYIPPERRIRIQACNTCNLNCPPCHWDEFEKDKRPHYTEVMKLINNLKKDGQNTSIHPRPKISFTLTGGEPLFNEDHWEEFIQVVKVYETDNEGNKVNSAYLLTNGTLLDEDKIGVLKQEGLRKIRVSLNYDENGEISEKVTRIENIKHLLTKINDIEVRFNHVIRADTFKDISLFNGEIFQFHSFILENFGEWIPNNVKEIGFIQETGNKDIDIFLLAKQWCKTNGIAPQPNYLGTRKLAAKLLNGLMVTFIKLNCDVKDDYIARCFDCVQERDIGISADARVRICSGWNEHLKPQFKYAQIDFEHPLVGIAGVIRRQYGLAGFYGHFPFWVNKLENKPVPGFFQQKLFDGNSLKGLLKQIGCPIDKDDLNSIIPHIAGIILKGDSPFKKLYEEGSYDQKSLEHSTQLCELLLRAAYDATQGLKDSHDRMLLNGILLILGYLTIDEGLFSTGRTVLVRGMAERLMRELATGIDPEATALLTQAAYCIATIAFENVDPRVVDCFINAILEDELQQMSCEILYLKGCIYRQLSGEEKDQQKKEVIVQQAINAFKKCHEISEQKLTRQKLKEQQSKLYKEIRAESRRSLGAITKNIPGREEESRKHFLISEFLGALDKTFLRYHSLFSEGYASLCNYFTKEYGKPDINLPEEGYKAYKCLSDSIALNDEFYASLIRIALLELAFDRPKYAKAHLMQAKNVFSRRGLLTDQEYLNSILCRLILLYTLYELDKQNFNMSQFSQLLDLNIEDCTKVGARDIQCVQEDAEILKKVIQNKQGTLKSDKILAKIDSHINEFIKGCEELLQIKQKTGATP